MLQGKLVSGAHAMDARTALEIATRGGAGCLGRQGELGQLSAGAVADIAIWDLEGPLYAGVIDDPIEGWLRCGPTSARDTVVAGRFVVRGGELVSPELGTRLTQHRAAAARFQAD